MQQEDNRINKLIQDIIEVGKRCYSRGLCVADEGNISVRIDDNRFLCTASGSMKGYLKEEDIILIDRNGTVIKGDKNSSTETPMHLYIYRQRPDVGAVLHAHPPFATGFAAARIPLDRCVLPEIVVHLGSVPLVEYGTPGTEEFYKGMQSYIAKRDVILLANHGIVSAGSDVYDAYFKLERVEQFARILFIARMLGGEVELSKNDIEKLRAQFGEFMAETCSI